MAPAPRFILSLWSFFRRVRRNPSLLSAHKRVWRPDRSLPLSVEQLEARNLLSATLLTDKPDYSPGDTAVITGSGFEVGETIQLQVVRTDGVSDYPPGNQPWQVTDGGDGDLDGRADGNLQTTWFVENQYRGATLLVSATGLTSGTTAQAAFTDAPDTTGPAATNLSISPDPANTPPTITATID